MSSHTDKNLEDDEMTPSVDTDARDEQDEERWIDSESEEEGWDDSDEEELPPRPRGRLLKPLPLALIAVVIAAAGFIGGIEAQKSSESGSEGAGGLAAGGSGGLPSFGKEGGSEEEGGSTEGGTEAGAEGASGVPSFGGGSEAAASGTVTSVEGNTIFVKEEGGTTVEVKIGDGATVTRNSEVSAKKIHPGDTVTVEGSKNGSTVKASSVESTEQGVESSSSGFPSGGAVGGSGGGSEEEEVEGLFEE